jgi:hypothetical protein
MLKRETYCSHPDQTWCDCDWCRLVRADDSKRQERNRRARINRQARHELMTDCGLVRGKDSMGRVIYE